MTCSLDGYGQGSLVLCTVAGDSSGKDFSSLRYVAFQLVYVLVIDLVVLFSAEYANFLSSASASSLHGRVSISIFTVSHGLFLLF